MNRRVLNLKNLSVIFVIIINLFLTQLPLTGSLGFEHAALNSIILFFISGLFTISVERKCAGSTSSLVSLLRGNEIYFAILFSIPLLIGTISTLFFSACPFEYGILFYLIITLPSLVFSFIAAAFFVSITRRFAVWLFILFFLFLLLMPLAEIYINPQVYFYNTILGYFPGTIYDEEMAVDTGLILYRLTGFVYFGLTGTITRYLLLKKISKTKSALMVFTILLASLFLKPLLGFTTTFAALTEKLNRKIVTDNFEIYYSPALKNFNPRLAGLLHEYYFEEVKKLLAVKPDKKIISFIFNDADEKRRLFGAGSADVAKPWLSQIYLNAGDLDATLKHELVHILAGEFGEPPFLIAENINPALTEGLAMAVENNFDNYPVHYGAKIVFEKEKDFSPGRLFAGFNFFGSTSSLSYVVTGSFVKFLIDSYGIDKVKALYSDIDFKKQFGLEENALFSQYKNFIDSLRLDYNSHTAQLYFGGTTIFKKFCPRFAAYQTKQANKLFAAGNYSKAEQLYRRVYNYSGSYQSLSGIINCSIQNENYSGAINLIEAEKRKFEKSPFLYNLLLLLGDLNIRNDNSGRGVALYDSLYVMNPHIAYTNQILIRKKLSGISDSELKRYLSGGRMERYALLSNLNSDSIFYPAIPTLLSYAPANEVTHLFNKLAGRIAIRNFEEAYSVYIMSKHALMQGEFKLAQDLAIESLGYKENLFFAEALKENLKLINWHFNFAESVEIEIK